MLCNHNFVNVNKSITIATGLAKLRYQKCYHGRADQTKKLQIFVKKKAQIRSKCRITLLTSSLKPTKSLHNNSSELGLFA